MDLLFWQRGVPAKPRTLGESRHLDSRVTLLAAGLVAAQTEIP